MHIFFTNISNTFTAYYINLIIFWSQIVHCYYMNACITYLGPCLWVASNSRPVWRNLRSIRRTWKRPIRVILRFLDNRRTWSYRSLRKFRISVLSNGSVNTIMIMKKSQYIFVPIFIFIRILNGRWSRRIPQSDTKTLHNILFSTKSQYLNSSVN